MDNISVDKLSTRTHKNISSKIFAPLVLVRGGAGTARRGVLTATETGDWRLGRVWQLQGPAHAGMLTLTPTLPLTWSVGIFLEIQGWINYI